MKTTRKMTKALFRGVLVLLFTFIPVSHAVAQECVLPPAGLVSWWPFDESADDIQDGNPGTLFNGATFTPGLVGNALSLDGRDDYVEIVNAPNLNFGQGGFTFEAWVNKVGIERGVLVIHGAVSFVTPEDRGQWRAISAFLGKTGASSAAFVSHGGKPGRKFAGNTNTSRKKFSGKPRRPSQRRRPAAQR